MTRDPRILPAAPLVELEIVRELPEGGAGFLALRKLELVAVRGGAGASRAFPYDVVDRRALDACVIVAHHLERGGVCVWLRSCVRPPLALRAVEPTSSGVLWELPAGLVEPGESPRAAAARELDEELGFSVDARALAPLGPWSAPAPGFIGEVHSFFHVRVDPASRREPRGDGSPLEDDARVVSVPLAAALEACARGEIRDAKTELALRRLNDALDGGGA